MEFEQTWLKQSKIFIMDDQAFNIELLERILKRAGFDRMISTTDPMQFEELFLDYRPDIVLLDLHMPHIDGFAALARLKQIVHEDDYLPVLVLTADVTPEAKQRALREGANDFLTKPFDRSEVVLRITNLLKTRYLHMQLQLHNQQLEQKVSERTAELEEAQLEILRILARSAEYRDDVTGEHTQRVGRLAGLTARALGLPEEDVEQIESAAALHDIGKIGIPDHILLKPGKFSPDEFEKMKVHTSIGAHIIGDAFFPTLRLASEIALHHHERWDGNGYPAGLKGEEIPLPARIVAIADFYDALTHERPYKAAWSTDETIQEIERQQGKHFDPVVTEAFLTVVRSQNTATPI
ncbi:HD domain-containing phosphohydrolase [Paenibacillus koleovorans]|uniref:HD domain-containing phosphohydrolase n=1 Tax=Paenibacillus koleovorans TaxID=121608 RepID=UPI000FD98778|nr:HD domain-containing phosphohydrolase [Paenibacillus koleovorans]